MPTLMTMRVIESRQRPVDQAIGDEALVRHDDFAVVPVDDRRRARADARDRAFDVADRDDVADAERAFEQHHQSGDEIGEDFLQAETEADRETGGEPLQAAPVQAEQRQAGDRAGEHDDVTRDRW